MDSSIEYDLILELKRVVRSGQFNGILFVRPLEQASSLYLHFV